MSLAEQDENRFRFSIFCFPRKLHENVNTFFKEISKLSSIRKSTSFTVKTTKKKKKVEEEEAIRDRSWYLQGGTCYYRVFHGISGNYVRVIIAEIGIDAIREETNTHAPLHNEVATLWRLPDARNSHALFSVPLLELESLHNFLRHVLRRILRCCVLLSKVKEWVRSDFTVSSFAPFIPARVSSADNGIFACFTVLPVTLCARYIIHHLPNILQNFQFSDNKLLFT